MENGLSIKEHLKEDMHITIGRDKEFCFFMIGASGKIMVPNDFKIEASDTLFNGQSCLKYVITDLTQQRRFSRVVKMDYCGIIEIYDRKTQLMWKEVK